MKGIVFTTFNDMVVERFGLPTWEAILQKVNPKSGGIYTAGGTYPFSELQTMVMELGKLKNIEVPVLLEAYGVYMFDVLAQKYPIFLQQENLKDFLKSIHNVIHVEVKKLYPDASLPSLVYEDLGSNKLALNYQSPRKLCFLACGLIHGAAKHYDVSVDITQPICMYQNADHCRLVVEVNKHVKG